MMFIQLINCIQMEMIFMKLLAALLYIVLILQILAPHFLVMIQAVENKSKRFVMMSN